jgi:hypothetical protein
MINTFNWVSTFVLNMSNGPVSLEEPKEIIKMLSN